MESNRNSIVPDLLDDTNYRIWSNCMEDYLLSQNLWVVIKEDEPETSESSPDSSNNDVKIIWTKKNASALHAIKMSCSPKVLSPVVEVKSAKQVWNMLASQFSIVTDSNTKIINNDDKQSTHSDIQVENDDTNYGSFVQNTEYGNWSEMEELIDSHPKALTATLFQEGGTALHYCSRFGLEKIAMSLVDRMEAKDLEIKDGNGFTALSLAASRSDMIDLVRAMVAKNRKLASIGDETTLPVVLAAKYGLEDVTNFLFQKTARNALSPCTSKAGVTLLIRCLDLNNFDIPLKLVTRFPSILEQSHADGTFPILSFARKFSTLISEVMQKKSSGVAKRMTLYEAFQSDGKIGAIKLLNLVCKKVSSFDNVTLEDTVGAAMIEAARNETLEFIIPMLRANPYLFWARDEKGRTMFWHAVVNRNPEIFTLIYEAGEFDQGLLLHHYDEDSNHTLHYAAMLPPMPTLDRISTSPVLQIKMEFQWFKEVQRMVNPRHRKDLNRDGSTPRELFDQTHKLLMQSGEKMMKETAQSCTTVGALIVTITFAAAFTVPGGYNSDTGYPLFKGDILFNIFIVCDALSLSSSTASMLIFLEILTSSYVNEDSVHHLPRKIMMGLLSLFISITTMMLTFCTAIAIMFDGLSHYILPISLLASSPVVLFSSSIFSLIYQIYTFTFELGIFKRNTKLREMKEFDEIMEDQSIISTELSDEQEDMMIPKSRFHVDEIV